MKNEFLHGDCLELMKNIPDASIDMILCDLPYGTTACKWDTIIPFNKLWEQYERIIKPNGAIVLTASQPFTSALVMSNPKMFKYEWIWDKFVGNNIFQVKQQPIKQHENILVFSNGKINYTPIMVRKDKPQHQCKYKNLYENGVTNKKAKQSLAGKIYTHSYPKSILIYPKNKERHHSLHPTQKPVALFEYLIKTYTNEGDTVLDNCAGSGTTAIACLNTNRQFIVMEKEQEYYDIIVNRVADWHRNKESELF
jgi:site-specific DNA-methyltransferase (adenine-specific)